MRRIETMLVKRTTHELMEIYGGRFSGDFEKNILFADGLVNAPSKKLRNVVAGYVTRLVKKNQGE